MVWNYVNKAATDYSTEKPSATWNSLNLLQQAEKDTALPTKLLNQLIVVNGNIKHIQTDSASTTIELGDSSSASSITCQIDPRYRSDFQRMKEGIRVEIKGKLTAITTDTELGTGTTIEMNFCTLNKTTNHE